MKYLLFINWFFLAIVVPTIAREICTSCLQMKSEGDCQRFGNCKWASAAGASDKSCQVTQPSTSDVYVPFCTRIVDAAECAQTQGCAYLSKQCTNFAGCSAYIKSTTIDCQAVSNYCISNDKSCKDASACDDYSKDQCSNTPSRGGSNCTLDSTTNKCSYLKCKDADISYTTDAACKRYSPDCLTTGAGCVTSPLPVCSGLNGTEQTCIAMTGSDGKCIYSSELKRCRLKLCSDAQATFTTNVECKNFLSSCVTKGKGCRDVSETCSSFQVDDPPTQCKGLIGLDGVCAGDTGKKTCRLLGKCSDNSGTITECQSIKGSDGNCTGSSTGKCQLKGCATDSTPATSFTTDTQCKTIQDYCLTTGLGCVDQLQGCSTYTATQDDGSDCMNRIGSEGKCKYSGSGKACAPRVCTEAKAENFSVTGCANFSKGCVYDGERCILQSTCNNTVSLSACQGTIEDSVSCNWNSICVDKTNCSNFNTEALCNNNSAYFITSYGVTTKTPCKWNNECGIKTCSEFKGNKSKCLEYDSYCTNINDQISNDTPCIDRTCKDQEAYKTGCNVYLPKCLVNEVSCIDSTQTLTCEEQLGLQDDCNKLTGYVDGESRIQCWSQKVSGTQGNCVKKECQLATGKKNDNDCSTFRSGCIHDGNDSCVEQNSSDRKCSDYASWADKKPNPSDLECAAFIPSSDATKPNCVSNGIKCVPSSTKCKDFIGTVDTCPQFKAYDAPCKATTQASSGGPCTVRVCTEAPNYTTDTECKRYHGSCVTTGRGCIASSAFNCKNGQTEVACGANISCVWAYQCRSAPSVCSALTSYGQSICANTLLNTGKQCAWYIDTCREFTCADYDATLTTHKACQNKDLDCTTSGAGCVSYSTCNTYSTKTVCEAAETIETSKKCQWDEFLCRERQCTDNKVANLDSDCNTYLAGCKTTGAGCIGGTYGCNVFDGNQKFCIKDSDGSPCYYVQSKCQSYKECKDVKSSSLAYCQLFNPLCVLGETGCIAQSSCELYSEISCTIGANNTICQWVEGKCKTKTSCTDTKGQTNDACKLTISGFNCVSDGTHCIPQDECKTYSNQISCKGGGTDGVCVFMANGTCQKFTECSQASSDQTTCTNNNSCIYINKSCKSRTCDNQPKCENVPNFQGQPFLTCLVVNNICIASDPSVLKSDTCYLGSNRTYTWNDVTQRCESCQERTTVQNALSSTNAISSGSLFKFVIPFLISGLFG